MRYFGFDLGDGESAEVENRCGQQGRCAPRSRRLVEVLQLTCAA